MAQDPFSFLLYRSGLLGALLGLVSSLYFLAGLAGYISSPVLNIAAAASVTLAALYFIYLFFGRLWDRSRLGSVIWFLILSLLIVEVLLGLVPPTARDELTHHLAIPKLYVKAGRIFEIPFASYSYYPMLLDMLYTPWIQWGWDSVPKLIHGFFGFLTALLIYAYLARRLSPIYGLLGFFFFVSTPAIVRLNNWAYVDLGLTFYSTASLLCLLQWIEATQISNFEFPVREPHGPEGNRGRISKSTRWLVLAGLSAGFAFATKPNGLLVVFLLLFLQLWVLGRARSGLKQIVFCFSVFFMAVLIACSPWLLKNLSQTGNPFFPFFTGLFGGKVGVGSEEGLGILEWRWLIYGESWWQIAALPLRVFFTGQDDKPQYFDGVLNPMLILFLPWVFKGKWVEEKKLLFGFALFYFLYSLFLAGMRIRYILPIVPPLVILLVYGLHNIYLRIARPSLLFAAVILLLTLNGAYLLRYFREVSPVGYLMGKVDRETYLSRRLPEYPVIQYINRSLPASARIYVMFVGRRLYYCERDYFYDGGDIPWSLLNIIKTSQTEEQIKTKLQERGITHLLMRYDRLVGFLNYNLRLDELELWRRFQDGHLKNLFGQRGYGVFELDRDSRL